MVARENLDGLLHGPFLPIRVSMAPVPDFRKFPDLSDRTHVAPRNISDRAPFIRLCRVTEKQLHRACVDNILPCLLHLYRKVNDEIFIQQNAILDPDGHGRVNSAQSGLDCPCSADEMHDSKRAPDTVAPPFAVTQCHHTRCRRSGKWMRNPYLIGTRVEDNAMVISESVEPGPDLHVVATQMCR